MPELPEVETIVRFLRPRVVGKKILKLASDTPRLFRGHQSISEVRRKVDGRKILGLDRLGKNIFFRLEGGVCFSIHLMMTGRLLWNPPVKGVHDRAKIILSGDHSLVLNDIRKFGRCRIVENAKKLFGPDALVITLDKFQAAAASRKIAVKNFLLDQRVLAGVGNIYADEILWYAGIRPDRRTEKFNPAEIKAIYGAMRKVLCCAIQKGGTTSRDYRKPDGSEGGYYKIRKAYQKTGERCARQDGGIIKRIVIGQRSAHYCPKHQR